MSAPARRPPGTGSVRLTAGSTLPAAGSAPPPTESGQSPRGYGQRPGGLPAPARPARGTVLRATVTPLASIFGSGFLIIVPALETTLGALAVVGTLGVVLLAALVGTSIRHNVRVAEPRLADGSIDAATRRIDRSSDAVIVVAYVISVALYLRIMAQYLVDSASGGFAEKAIACAGVVLIVAIGTLRGFKGLDAVERAALVLVLIIVVVLVAVFAVHDLRTPVTLPPVPDTGVLEALLVLGGVVITVQGFETVRYLGEEFDAETRIRASRLAQLVAGVVYVAFVAVATPLMGLGTPAGPDATLLDLLRRTAPLLTVPLVVGAVLSQFSAATADTVAADGNLRSLIAGLRAPRSYLVSGVAAVLLAATVPTFTIVAIASRAFAAYYGLQAVVSLRTSTGLVRKGAYGLLALLLLAITLLARPAG